MVHRSLLIKRYVFGIGLFVAGIFLALSLCSFNQHDASPYCHIASTKPVLMHNICGVVGSYTSAFLFHSFGSAAFLLIPLLLLLGWLVTLGSRFFFDGMHFVGLALLAAFWSLFTAQAGGDFCCVGEPGGACGTWCMQTFTTFFDALVLSSITTVLLCMGAVLVLRFAWAHALCTAGRWCWSCAGGATLKDAIVTPIQKGMQWSKNFIKTKWQSGVARIQNWVSCWIVPLISRLPFGSFFTHQTEQAKNVQDLSEDELAAEALFERFRQERGVENSEDAFDESFWLEIQKDLGACLPKNTESVEQLGHDKEPLFSVAEMPLKTALVKDSDGEVPFVLPSLALLQPSKEPVANREREKTARERSLQLEEKLRLFGIEGRVLSTTIGPVVTLFEYAPAENVKISRIVGLEDDLTLALGALSLRVIAPLPGRQAVGFEVANTVRDMVSFSACVTSKVFTHETRALPLIIGRDTRGNDVVADLATLPHLLVAGSTGSGKSVALHTMLLSLLYARTPDELKLVLVDPKRLEFAAYADIPHLLIPVVTDVPQVPKVLSWLAQVMDERYRALAKAGVRNIAEYRALALHSLQTESMPSIPSIVVVIDELADIMMVAKKEVEPGLARLAQMARAAGIHLIVATQRPSVDVLTGLVKVNFPARIAFKVASKIDSRTILDQTGAEKLLGKGDLLFLHPKGTCERMQGAFVHDAELHAVLEYIRAQRSPEYEVVDEGGNGGSGGNGGDDAGDANDPLLGDVERFVKSVDEVSISLIQRKFRIGYNRSARLIDLLEARGIILPALGGKMRKVVKDLFLS